MPFVVERVEIVIFMVFGHLLLVRILCCFLIPAAAEKMILRMSIFESKYFFIKKMKNRRQVYRAQIMDVLLAHKMAYQHAFAPITVAGIFVGSKSHRMNVLPYLHGNGILKECIGLLKVKQ